MQSASGVTRHYGMDWLRIGAFALLIFYHIGMFYVPWVWHVKAPQIAERATIAMLFTNGWRLSLLFLVSGYASAAMLAKRPSLRGFAVSRSARLLVPLAFGMAVIVPPQPWIQLVGQHGYVHGFAHFWTQDYFRFGSIKGITLPTWQHLWFVAYLFVYSLVLALVLSLPKAIGSFASAGFDRMFARPALLLLLPIGWICLRSFLLWPGVEDTHGLFDDAAAHWIYFPAFLFGFGMQNSALLWDAIRKSWKVALVIALGGYAIIAGLEWVYPGETPAPRSLVELFITARAVNAWCMIVALLGIADRFLNRDHPWRPTLNEAIFPFYIVHQTLIVVVGWWVVYAGLPNAISFPLLVVMTALGCWLFYRLGREVPVLRLLIGLKGWRVPSSNAQKDAALVAA